MMMARPRTIFSGSNMAAPFDLADQGELVTLAAVRLHHDDTDVELLLPHADLLGASVGN